MIPEEALKWLDEHNTSGVLPLEVKVLCSKALEKQIPKKPTHTYKRCGFIVEGCCPICNRSVLPENKGCPRCLQAIDWSEE